jgi:hypothetical protein
MTRRPFEPSHEAFAELGIFLSRKLPSGEWAGVQRMMFTVALLVGLDEFGYRTRFCYPLGMPAIEALAAWDGHGDPPGPWIKEKGEGGDRTNPRHLAGIPIVIEAVE